jgi:hypothetical protein
MLPFPVREITESQLRQICTDRWPESATLDFKARLPLAADKQEFLKDVCAFANHNGGDLIYGVGADGVGAKAIVPITGEQPDNAERRLRQMVEAGAEPVISGIEVAAIPVPGGYVLVVRVPASFNGPHRFLNGSGYSRFVTRCGPITADMSFEQFRVAFDRTATLGHRARQFRMGRLQSVRAREVWKPLMSGPTCVVHVIPVSSMGGQQVVNVGELNRKYDVLRLHGWTGESHSMNLDGLVVYPPPVALEGGRTFHSYVLAFRMGMIEATRFAGMLSDQSQPIIPSTVVADFVRDALQKSLTAAQSFHVVGPAIAAVALMSVDGYRFGVGDAYYSVVPSPADRGDLILPEHWIEELSAASDIDSIARPMLDIVWQCFGLERCLDYDKEGKWRPRQ